MGRGKLLRVKNGFTIGTEKFEEELQMTYVYIIAVVLAVVMLALNLVRDYGKKK